MPNDVICSIGSFIRGSSPQRGGWKLMTLEKPIDARPSRLTDSGRERERERERETINTRHTVWCTTTCLLPCRLISIRPTSTDFFIYIFSFSIFTFLVVASSGAKYIVRLFILFYFMLFPSQTFPLPPLPPKTFLIGYTGSFRRYVPAALVAPPPPPTAAAIKTFPTCTFHHRMRPVTSTTQQECHNFPIVYNREF